MNTILVSIVLIVRNGSELGHWVRRWLEALFYELCPTTVQVLRGDIPVMNLVPAEVSRFTKCTA